MERSKEKFSIKSSYDWAAKIKTEKQEHQKVWSKHYSVSQSASQSGSQSVSQPFSQSASASQPVQTSISRSLVRARWQEGRRQEDKCSYQSLCTSPISNAPEKILLVLLLDEVHFCHVAFFVWEESRLPLCRKNTSRLLA